MKFYVFCNHTHDGGWLQECNTFKEAQEYMKKDSDAEAIIYGKKIDWQKFDKLPGDTIYFKNIKNKEK